MGREPSDLHTTTGRYLSWGLALAAFAWIAIHLLMIVSDDAGRIGVHNGLWAMIAALFVLSLLDGIIVNLAALSSAITSVGADLTSGHWDMVMITDVDVRRIVRAKYAFAQVRAWRPMMTAFTLRSIVAGMAFASAFTMHALDSTTAPLFNPIGEAQMMPVQINAIVFLLGVPVLMVLYVMEVFLRFRVLTAISLAASARNGEQIPAMNDVVVGVMLTALLQIALVAAPVVLALTAFAHPDYELALPVSVALVTVMLLLWLYRWTTRWALGSAFASLSDWR